MADDEQFSLCWNNFNSNLSAGFHESLCRGDLVDVTLAAEGQFVKAHRLVLSVCSPYFRKMFTQMPANQHAFVFLKDVSHSALKDLIQFMYCGEVNVKQDALPAFISTAEALQIKGLTDGEPAPSQSPAKPSTPAPQQNVPGPSMISISSSPRVKQRSSTTRSSYKIESEDSGDDKSTQLHQTTAQQTQQNIIVQQQQTQKRPAQRSITPHTAPIVKRVKNSDPLEATDPTQITVQTVSDSKTNTDEPEFIDLPIDLPTKSEPDYAEETGEVETTEQETTYVEDDSYGDMKYDESYFTENDEAGGGGSGGGATTSATVKASSGTTFSESYVSDTGEQTTEAQVKRRGRPRSSHARQKKLSERLVDAIKNKVGKPIEYVSSISGGMKINFNGHHFKHIYKRGKFSVYQCSKNDNKNQCNAKILIYNKKVYHFENEHNHKDIAIDRTVTENIPYYQSDDNVIIKKNDDKHGNNDNNKCGIEILNFKVAATQLPSLSSTTAAITPATSATAVTTTNCSSQVTEIQTYTISSSNKEEDQKRQQHDEIFEIEDEEEHENEQENEENNVKTIKIENDDNDDDFMAPEDFKAKIKKRLQKALLGGKM